MWAVTVAPSHRGEPSAGSRWPAAMAEGLCWWLCWEPGCCRGGHWGIWCSWDPSPQSPRGNPKATAGPLCHLEETHGFALQGDSVMSPVSLFLTGFISHLLGKWNISWEVTHRDHRQVSRQRAARLHTSGTWLPATTPPPHPEQNLTSPPSGCWEGPLLVLEVSAARTSLAVSWPL